MIKAWVYKITSPTKRVYVGSTVNIRKRWSSYKRLDCRNQKRLYNSLKKYTAEKHTFDIICECTTFDVLKKEAYYGTLYNSLGKHGLNSSIPKLGEGYISMTEEKRKNISKSKIGTIQTYEHIEKCRLSRIGKNKSEECKKKMSNAAMGGKNHKAKLLLNTKTGIYYLCVMDAANSIGMNYNYFRSKLYPGSRNINNTGIVYV